MLSNKVHRTGLIALTLIIGLLVTSVVGIAGNEKGSSTKETGIMKETYINLLAPKLGLEAEQLDSIMNDAMSQAKDEEERPISENYLEILASKLNNDAETLKATMIETKVEAAEKLASEGTISEELATTFKERASTFPFGYSNQGADKGKGSRIATGNSGGSGNRYGSNDGSNKALQPEDGSGYGAGNGKADEGECSGDGPYGRKRNEDFERGQNNGGRGGK